MDDPMDFDVKPPEEMRVYIKDLNDANVDTMSICTNTITSLENFNPAKEYDAEAILTERSSGQIDGTEGTEYLIKWLNSGVLESTWEPESKLDNYKDTVFWQNWVNQKELQQSGKVEPFPVKLFHEKAKVYWEKKIKKRDAIRARARMQTREENPTNLATGLNDRQTDSNFQHTETALTIPQDSEDEIPLSVLVNISKARKLSQDACQTVGEKPFERNTPKEPKLTSNNPSKYINVNRFMLWQPNDRISSKAAFLWFENRDFAQQGAILKALKEENITVHAPGHDIWEKFVKTHTSGFVLFGPGFKEFWKLTDLPQKLEQRFNFFEFHKSISPGDIIGPYPTQIFRENRAIFISEECFQDYPSRSLKVLKDLEKRIKARGPTSTRILTRFGLIPWLRNSLDSEVPSSKMWDIRKQVFLLINSIMRSDPTFNVINEGVLEPTNKCPVYYPPARFFPSMVPPREAKETMVSFFSHWSIGERYNFRKFIVVTTESERNVASWQHRYKHLQFVTPEGFIEQETARDQAKRLLSK